MKLVDLEGLAFMDFNISFFQAIHNFSEKYIPRMGPYYSGKGQRLYDRLLYIDRGSAVFSCRRTFAANPGDLVLLPNDSVFSIQWQPYEGDDIANAYVIGFRLTDGDGETLYWAQDPYLLVQNAAALYGERFRAVVDAYETPRAGYRAKSKSLFLELLYTLLAKSAPDGCVAEAVAYMKRHYAEPFSIAALAQRCHVSESTLRRQFKLSVGMSPCTYVNHLKMQRASELLLDGHMRMTDIAGALGMTDSAYFSKVFKDFYGISPLKFRSNPF